MRSENPPKSWSGLRYRMLMALSALRLAACGGALPLDADSVSTRPQGLESTNQVLILAVIVLIRTFLSFTLEVELEGRWPWQKRPPAAPA